MGVWEADQWSPSRGLVVDLRAVLEDEGGGPCSSGGLSGREAGQRFMARTQVALECTGGGRE